LLRFEGSGEKKKKIWGLNTFLMQKERDPGRRGGGERNKGKRKKTYNNLSLPRRGKIEDKKGKGKKKEGRRIAEQPCFSEMSFSYSIQRRGKKKKGKDK